MTLQATAARLVLILSMTAMACSGRVGGTQFDDPDPVVPDDASVTSPGDAPDSGAADASTADASTADASTADASTADASTADASIADASIADASTADASTADASTADASTADASTADASTADASTPDASTPDASTGVCGIANGVAVPAAPASGLCSAGTPSSVTGSGPWVWTCAGANGGANASCSAPLQSTGPGTTASSVTQWGITWTFDKAYEVGQFVNGDWWVVGPVRVTSIAPALSGGLNGSVINPMPSWSQGYDVRANSYDPSLSVQVPVTLPVNSSLVTATSDPDAADGNNAVYLTTAAVLTSLPSAPPAGSFRPGYCGSNKPPMHNISELRPQLLPKLARVANAPSPASLVPQFQRVWLDHQFDWTGGQIHPAQNLPNYGRELSSLVSEAALTLLLDYTDADKRSLLINLVQVGIDSYSAVQNGMKWGYSGGGWQQGRKFPIVFAGYVLNDPDMLHIGNRFHPPETPALSGEDYQTFYVTQADIDMIHTTQGGVVIPGRYTQAQLGMPEWGSVHWMGGAPGQYDVTDWNGDDYRQCCTANSWAGTVLAVHILGLKAAWNWDALFDYTDKYEDVEYQSDNWIRFGFDNGFVKNMWTTYRSQYGCIYVLDTPHSATSNGRLDCSACVNQCP